MSWVSILIHLIGFVVVVSGISMIILGNINRLEGDGLLVSGWFVLLAGSFVVYVMVGLLAPVSYITTEINPIVTMTPFAAVIEYKDYRFVLTDVKSYNKIKENKVRFVLKRNKNLYGLNTPDPTKLLVIERTNNERRTEGQYSQFSVKGSEECGRATAQDND